MPSVTVKQLMETQGIDISLMSRIYEVSEAMARAHIRKLRWLPAG